MRRLLLRGLAGLHLQEITATSDEGALQLAATLISDDLGEAIEHAVQRIAAEPGIGSLRWMAVDDI